MLKGGTPLGPGSQLLYSPERIEEGEDTGVGVFAAVVDGLVLDQPLADPGRDQYGRNTDPQSVKGEGYVLAVLGLLRICEAVSCWDTDFGNVRLDR